VEHVARRHREILAAQRCGSVVHLVRVGVGVGVRVRDRVGVRDAVRDGVRDGVGMG